MAVKKKLEAAVLGQEDVVLTPYEAAVILTVVQDLNKKLARTHQIAQAHEEAAHEHYRHQERERGKWGVYG